MRAGRKFRIGHLFFKYVQGTALERSVFNTSKKLGQELHRLKLIELYRENDQGKLEQVGSVQEATWYGYTVGNEYTKRELETLLSKGAA